MTEGDKTRDLSDSEKLDLILSRLAALEATEAERSKETRPKLDAIHAYVDQLSQDMQEVKAGIRQLNRRFETLAGDIVDLRNRQSDVEQRLDSIERKPS